MKEPHHIKPVIWQLISLICIVLLLSCSCGGPATKIQPVVSNLSEPQVRVRVINTLDTVCIKFLDTWQVYTPDKIPHKFHKHDRIYLTESENQINCLDEGRKTFLYGDSLSLTGVHQSGEIEIKSVPYGIGWWWAGEEDRRYEGKISVYPSGTGKPEIVISLPLDNYLCGVVPYEIGGDSPLEALKAQAVAARSEAVMALTSDMYRGRHHDLTSDVECQVFSGNQKRTQKSDQAIHDTRGLILTHAGRPINAYYASNCGGYSEQISHVWPDRPAPETYLRTGKDSKYRPLTDLDSEYNVREWIFSKPPVFCNPHLETELPSWSQKNFRWQKKFNIDSLTKMINGDNDLGKLVTIRAIKRGSSGRIYHARFIFEQDSFEVSGELAIRQMWQPALRSSCFVGDSDGEHYILNGAGWGHGVGMCQSGAVAQAIHGTDFKSILEHYYPQAEIVSVYQ